MRLLLPALLGAAILGWCGPSREVVAQARPDAQAKTDDIELAAGASATVGSTGVTLIFERVESDSRCPAGARCVWAGDAVVRLGIEARGKSKSRTIVRLHTNPREPREVRQAGLRIRLVALEPRPTLDREIDPDEYRVRLSVAKDTD